MPMNLLTDPLLRVRTASAERALSLPALMASLGREPDVSLPGLQRHQADAFHVFLCYLAGAVLARAGASDPVQDEAFWREGLRALAGEAGDDAWTLVVEDPLRPAFMQPPIPAREHGKLKPKAETPDALDLLPTAKNHDVKQARAAHAHPDEWIYALVSLQTMSGYLGRGNQGISRMNSGFGNRPVIELVRSLDPASRWRDAVLRLLRHRQEVIDGPNPWGFVRDGLVLVWLREWDGRTSMPTKELDPCYVEICRRIRLRGTDGASVRAEALPAESPRIAAKELNGVMGDAWLPVDKSGDEQKSLTVSPQGLTADLLRRLLFADGLEMTALHRPGPGWEGSLWLSVSVLVRGQGTTDGFHERQLPIPAEARPRLFGPPELRERFAALARTAVEQAGIVHRQALRPAVFALLEGGPEDLRLDRDAIQAWWAAAARRFESLWTADYFPWLWRVPDDFDRARCERDWAKRLRAHALRVLAEAEAGLPARSGRRYRARVAAERILLGAIRRHLSLTEEELHERAGTA